MTTSSTNIPIDHAAEALGCLGGAVLGDAMAMRGLARAQVHATLALAHEQRTANLIAYLALAQGRPTAERLRDNIEARLGLGEPA